MWHQNAQQGLSLWDFFNLRHPPTSSRILHPLPRLFLTCQWHLVSFLLLCGVGRLRFVYLALFMMFNSICDLFVWVSSV